jgi:hypothetical protein
VTNTSGLRDAMMMARGIAYGAERLVLACGPAGVVIFNSNRIRAVVSVGTPNEPKNVQTIARHVTIAELAGDERILEAASVDAVISADTRALSLRDGRTVAPSRRFFSRRKGFGRGCLNKNETT